MLFSFFFPTQEDQGPILPVWYDDHVEEEEPLLRQPEEGDGVNETNSKDIGETKKKKKKKDVQAHIPLKLIGIVAICILLLAIVLVIVFYKPSRRFLKRLGDRNVGVGASWRVLMLERKHVQLQDPELEDFACGEQREETSPSAKIFNCWTHDGERKRECYIKITNTGETNPEKTSETVSDDSNEWREIPIARQGEISAGYVDRGYNYFFVMDKRLNPTAELFLLDKFHCSKKLGEGSFANVYLCKALQAQKVNDANPEMGALLEIVKDEEYSIKIGKRGLLTSPIAKNMFQKEQCFYKNYEGRRNNHLISGLGHGAKGEALKLKLSDDGLPYIIMEYGGDSLDDFLEKFHKNQIQMPAFSLNEGFVLDVFHQAAQGLSALHEAGWVHLDLKPQNIAIKPNINGTYVVKIIDLGFAKKTNDGVFPDVGSCYFTPIFEIIKKEYDQSAVDIWMLGVTIVQLFLKPDFHWLPKLYCPNVDDPKVAQEALDNQFKTRQSEFAIPPPSDGLTDLLKSMIKVKTGERCSKETLKGSLSALRAMAEVKP